LLRSLLNRASETREPQRGHDYQVTCEGRRRPHETGARWPR
jgi:hypothetical protein